MTINFFQTLNTVLTKGIADICRDKRLTREEAINQCRIYLEENSAQYYLTNPCLNYENPFCRWAYLYTYVGAHANLIDNALTDIEELYNLVKRKIDENGQLRVCSLGGGPGSELLGFVKFIDRNRRLGEQVAIDFLLIDKVGQWDDSWHSLVKGLETTFKEQYGNDRRQWPVQINRSFLSRNLVDTDNFEGFSTRFRDTDLFILNHVVSELLSYPLELQNVLNSIVDRSEYGAYYLFIDRNQSQVLELTTDLIDNCPDLYLQQHTLHKQNMDPDEQKTDLGIWYDRMNRDPKLRWNAFFSLGIKSPF